MLGPEQVFTPAEGLKKDEVASVEEGTPTRYQLLQGFLAETGDLAQAVEKMRAY